MCVCVLNKTKVLVLSESDPAKYPMIIDMNIHILSIYPVCIYIYHSTDINISVNKIDITS